MKKLWGKRGKFLTIVLILSLLIDIFNVLSPINHLADYLGFFNTESYKIIHFLIHLIILCGMWKMKKWGVYLWYITLLILPYIIHLSYSHIKTTIPDIVVGFLVLGVLILIISIGLPTWAIKRKWKDFS